MRQPIQLDPAAASIDSRANTGWPAPSARSRLNELVTARSPKRHTAVSMKFLAL